MTLHPIEQPRDFSASKRDKRHIAQRLDFIEERLNEAFEVIPEMSRDIAELIQRIESLDVGEKSTRTRGVSAPGAAALALMAEHPGMALTATWWERNGGGKFSDAVLRTLAGLGMVDRLDHNLEPDATGILYRINEHGIAWLEAAR